MPTIAAAQSARRTGRSRRDPVPKAAATTPLPLLEKVETGAERQALVARIEADLVNGNEDAKGICRLGRAEKVVARLQGEARTRQAILALEPIGAQQIRNESSVSFLPFFSLQKKPPTTPLSYLSDKFQVSITPGPGGLPTIWDKAVIIVALSALNRAVDRGETPSRTIILTAAEIIRAIRPGATARNISSVEYDGLRASLDRLKSALVRTNIKSGGRRAEGAFNLISEWSILSSSHDDGSGEGNERMEAIRIVLCEWLYNAVVIDRRVLRLAPAYFELPPLERRLYEIALRVCWRAPSANKPSGFAQSRPIPLPELAQLVGTQVSRLRKFKSEVKEVEAEQQLPDYTIHVIGDPSSGTGALMVAAGLLKERADKRGSDGISVIFRPREGSAPASATVADPIEMVTIPNL